MEQVRVRMHTKGTVEFTHNCGEDEIAIEAFVDDKLASEIGAEYDYVITFWDDQIVEVEIDVYSTDTVNYYRDYVCGDDIDLESGDFFTEDNMYDIGASKVISASDDYNWEWC